MLIQSAPYQSLYHFPASLDRPRNRRMEHAVTTWTCYTLESICMNDLGKHAATVFNGSRLGGVVVMDDSEPWAVTTSPFKVIDERPYNLSCYWRSILNRTM
jgi:hypothetical protein